MMAGFAMLILAFGALLMVLCTGFGDADEERDDVTDPRGDAPDPLGGWSPHAGSPGGWSPGTGAPGNPGVQPPHAQPPGAWSPEADAALRRLRGRGFGLR